MVRRFLAKAAADARQFGIAGILDFVETEQGRFL
jgi:hypothetical protein